MSRTPDRGFNLFRVGGIQVAVDVSWLVIFALVLWSLSAGYFPQHEPGRGRTVYLAVGLAATLLFFASLLAHELAHALVANRLGLSVQRITLFVFGGMAHLTGEPRSPGVELRVAAVGPLTSAALAGLFWLLTRALELAGVEPLWLAVFRYLSFINAALAVFNLLPGFPLDGGRLLRAWFWHRSGDFGAASRRAADWGSGIAIGLMVLGAMQIFAGALVGGLWLILIGMFLRGSARASWYGVVIENALGRARVGDIMVREPVVIDPDLSVADAIEDYFLRYGYGGFPVASGDRAEGVLSLKMVQQCPREARATTRVRDVMRRDLDGIVIAAEAPVAEALGRMGDEHVGRLLVLSGDALVGLVTRSGVARFVDYKTRLET